MVQDLKSSQFYKEFTSLFGSQRTKFHLYKTRGLERFFNLSLVSLCSRNQCTSLFLHLQSTPHLLRLSLLSSAQCLLSSSSLWLNPQIRNYHIFEDKVESLTPSYCCCAFFSLFSRIPTKFSNSDIIVLRSSDMITEQCLVETL